MLIIYIITSKLTDFNKRGNREAAVPKCSLEQLFWTIQKFQRNFGAGGSYAFRKTFYNTSVVNSSL